jgi:hypothetical protein
MPLAHKLFLGASFALIVGMFAIALESSVDPGAEDRTTSPLIDSD